MNDEVLKHSGIQLALFNANRHCDGWGDMAYNFLVKFAERNFEFMTEQVREASKNTVPEPKNKRAWGGVIVKAQKNKIISSAGFNSVSNPKAHKAFACVWRSNILK